MFSYLTMLFPAFFFIAHLFLSTALECHYLVFCEGDQLVKAARDIASSSKNGLDSLLNSSIETVLKNNTSISWDILANPHYVMTSKQFQEAGAQAHSPELRSLWTFSERKKVDATRINYFKNALASSFQEEDPSVYWENKLAQGGNHILTSHVLTFSNSYARTEPDPELLFLKKEGEAIDGNPELIDFMLNALENSLCQMMQAHILPDFIQNTDLSDVRHQIISREAGSWGQTIFDASQREKTFSEQNDSENFSESSLERPLFLKAKTLACVSYGLMLACRHVDEQKRCAHHTPIGSESSFLTELAQSIAAFQEKTHQENNLLPEEARKILISTLAPTVFSRIITLLQWHSGQEAPHTHQ